MDTDGAREQNRTRGRESSRRCNCAPIVSSLPSSTLPPCISSIPTRATCLRLLGSESLDRLFFETFSKDRDLRDRGVNFIDETLFGSVP